jgi:hypothetical protein
MTTLPKMTFRPASRQLHPAFIYASALALFAAFLYLLLRNAGAAPMVLADEWFYSHAARLLPFSESRLPSWLYLGLFSLTSACGDNFYDCARIFNGLLFVGTAPLIYLIASRVCSKRVSVLLAAISVFSPLNSYTAYFMPEAMYGFAFYAFAWGALSMRDAPRWQYALASGAMLGLMSVIKVHAMFLWPALCAFMLYLCHAREPGGRWLRAALQMALLALLALVVVKLALGFAFAGEAGLTLLGKFYTAHAHSNRDASGSLAVLLSAFPTSLRGHALGLVLLMGLPCATLALLAISAKARAEAGGEARALAVFTVLMLAAAVGMTVLFTASIAAGGAQEGIRLHMRYYNFLFPLLLIVAGSVLAARPLQLEQVKVASVAGVLFAALLYAGLTLGSAYAPMFIDAPELVVLNLHPKVFSAWLAAQLLLLALWCWRRKLAAQLFIFALLPLTALLYESGVREVFGRSVAVGADKAGKVVHQLLGDAVGGKLLVAGDPVGVYRALFHIDSADVGERLLAPAAPLLPTADDAQREWVLVIGQHPFAGAPAPFLKTAGYALYRMKTVIDFADPLGNGVLERTEGLARPERWGAWSDGKQVRLHFSEALPRRFMLIIKASAFGPNTGQPFTLDVGGQALPFRLGPQVTELALPIETDGLARSITIAVPQPASPQSLGQGNDARQLGLALARMEITGGTPSVFQAQTH